ncbi:MAG: hypothetical protein AAFQ23_13030, partial [Cyanobacteria bacterium J06623_1]
MKLFQLPLKIFIASIWIVLAAPSVRSQSGNMSDITMPSPDSMIVEPETQVDQPVADEPELDVDGDVEQPVADEPELDVDGDVE